MFVTGDTGDSPPTAMEYIFHGLFALFFLCFSVTMIIALFNDRVRAGFRSSKSRVGIVMALPFALFIPVRYLIALPAIIAGKDPSWNIPVWWFFPCGALFVLGLIYDGISRTK